MAAAEGAAQRAADLDLKFAHLLLAKHRIERHQLKNIDRLQFEFLRGPFHCFGRNKTKWKGSHHTAQVSSSVMLFQSKAWHLHGLDDCEP